MVIILGSTGYVGAQFVNELRNKDVGLLPLSRSEVDYYNLDILTELIKETKPNFLINCAGYTGKPNVDACENDKEETWKGNVTLPTIVAKACQRTGLPWGHVSSGCIYDGKNGGRGFSEEDAPNLTFDLGNCSYYSGTKVEGERCIEEVGGNYYIWRLRIPFDKYDSPRNYLSKLMNYEKLLNATNSISHREDFAKSCIDLVFDAKAPYGTYNVVNTGSVTTKQVADLIKEKFKDFSPLFFDDENHFYETAAKARRSNCILDNQKLLDAGVKIRTAEEAIIDSLKNWTKSV
jgi:UDP-glucose 4,6-dehydratase